jgi:hypothetical protein
VSGHNSTYLWWPRLPRDHVAITIGFDPDWLRRYYDDVQRVGTVHNSQRVHNYDWGDPICVARGLRVTPEKLRRLVKSFEA